MDSHDDHAAVADILANTAWMRRLAHRLVADAADRDEVVQQVWLEALRHAPRARNLRPWLAGVVRNVARMGFRGDARRRARESAVEEPAAAAATPEELITRIEAEREAATALLDVDEPYRSTLLLRYYEDLSSADIARRLGVPAATVRSRLKRGLEELRAKLDARNDGDRRRWSLALVPTAVAAGRGATNSIALAIGGALLMKAAAKIVLGALALLLLAWGGATWWRQRAPMRGIELTRAHAGVSWRAPGGSGIAVPPPVTQAGVIIPDWFGQPGAGVRRVAGRVTFAGAPVAGATVELGSALTDAGVLPITTRRTGSDGSFDFGMQAPARYSVAASAADHSAAVRQVDTRDPTIPSERVALQLGGCEAAIFGRVNDSSGGPIAGARLCWTPPRAAACSVTDDGGHYQMCLSAQQTDIQVRARGYGAVDEPIMLPTRRTRRDFLLTPEAVIVGRVVRGDDGRPVGGASVGSQSGEVGRRVAAAAATVSDGDGRFTLAALAPGRHRIFAFTSGLASGDPVEVNVEAGHTSAEILVRLRPAARIRGVVTDGHVPIVGATVTTVSAAPGLTVDAVTQADGSFVLDSVPRGRISFRVAPHDVIEPKALTIDGVEHQVRLVVQPLASVAGHVTRHGKPVAGVHVDVGTYEDIVFTDGDGAYLVRGLRPQKYQVNAVDMLAGVGGLSPEVTLAKGEQRTGVDIEMSYAGAISGVVVEENGTPAAGVHVGFHATHTIDLGETFTATDGSFRVGTLAGGDDYHAEVSQGHEWRHNLVPADGAFPVVHVSDGEAEVRGVRLVIKRAHSSIAGVAVDSDGQPLADVRVTAFRAAQGDERTSFNDLGYAQPGAITGGDGRFAIDDLDSGSFVLRARAGDGSEGRLEGVAAGQSGVVVRLQAAGAIDGELIGFTTSAQVSARNEISFAPSARLYADVSGSSFRFRGLTPGSYLVDVASDDGADVKVVQVEAGRTATVTLRNRGTAIIRGRVVDWRSGAGVEGFRCVAALSGAATFSPTHGTPAFTDAEGRFAIDNAPVGTSTILCGWTPQYSDGLCNVTVAAGQSGSCDIPVVKGKGGLDALAWFGGEIGTDPSLVVKIISVVPRGPAAKAGIKRGDILASVDGVSVTRLSPIGNEFAIRDRAPGSHVSVGVVRGGKEITTDVVITGSPAE